MFNINLNLDSLNADVLDKDNVYDLIVVGGGPGALNAGLYAKRKGLDVAIITENIGGALLDTSIIENYLGFSSISGANLTLEFENHLKQLDVKIKKASRVKEIRENNNLKEIILDNGDIYQSITVIIATGSLPRKLNVKGEEKLVGKGVAYCAICDGPFFANKKVVVAGGGNSAVESAIDLAKIAKEVVVVHRSNLSADQISIDKLESLSNVKIVTNTQIVEIIGDSTVESILVLDKNANKTYNIDTNGVFVEIGSIPNSKNFKQLVKLNDYNEIVVDRFKNTSVKGIFAAGDVTDTPYKQVITATADGAICALSASDYINKIK